MLQIITTGIALQCSVNKVGSSLLASAEGTIKTSSWREVQMIAISIFSMCFEAPSAKHKKKKQSYLNPVQVRCETGK